MAALSLAAADAQAQARQRDSSRAAISGQQDGKGSRGQRGDGFLLRGITLSDAQIARTRSARGIIPRRFELSCRPVNHGGHGELPL